MKQIFISLLFIISATSFIKGQTIVKLTLPDNCSSNIELTNITNPKTDNDFQVLVSPNPNTGKFVLTLSDKEIIGEATIHVLSKLGQTLYTETIYCNSKRLTKQMDLKNLLTGAYILNVHTETKNVSTKLIIN